jgi:hemoglobin
MTQTLPQIENLVNQFYSRVRSDELSSYVFDDVAQVDWDHHLPLLCQFWTSISLKTNEYNIRVTRLLSMWSLLRK